MEQNPALSGPAPPFDPERFAQLSPARLRRWHTELFGHDIPVSNLDHLRRKVAWELQARAEGRLPEAARELALSIAQHSVLRSRPLRHNGNPRVATTEQKAPSDPRLPRPGACLVRTYRQRQIVVQVLPSGFQFDGRYFTSLSSIAREVTGTRWNGFVFFGLIKPFRHARQTSR